MEMFLLPFTYGVEIIVGMVLQLEYSIVALFSRPFLLFVIIVCEFLIVQEGYQRMKHYMSIEGRCWEDTTSMHPVRLEV